MEREKQQLNSWSHMMTKGLETIQRGGSYEEYKACFKAPFDDDETLKSTYAYYCRKQEERNKEDK